MKFRLSNVLPGVAVYAFFFLILASSLGAAAAPPAKRVLIISTGSRLSPGFALMDRGVLEGLAKIPSEQIELYAENIDILRFPSDRFRRIFSEYLTEKYAAQRPDVIILVFVGNLEIAEKLLSRLFPGTPIVVAGATEEQVSVDQFRSPLSGLASRANPRATLELIFLLQPETRRVVVIGGTAEVDRDVLDRVKEAARSFTGQVEFEFWDNRSMGELQHAVAALPPRTAILFSRMFRDGAGQTVISTQVGRSIARWANVPVYVMTDTALGTGAVGGSVASIDAIGKRAGEMARLILTGTRPESLPLESDTGRVPMFDSRALQRWNIPENRLPPGSVVRFKPQSIWQQYGWYIIAALSIIAIQGAMISELLVQRARQRRTQALLEETHQLVELATSSGGLGLWSRDLRYGDVWANEPMRSLFGFGAHDALRFEDMLARVHPDDRSRMISEIERAQAAGLPFEGEFRILLPNGMERWLLAKGRTVVDSRERDARRLGVVMDITGRKQAEESLRESEARFRTMADTAPVMIWMSGPDKLCTFFNKSWLDFTGRTLEQELGNGWTEGIHREDVDRCLEIYTQSFNARQEFTMEYRSRRFDGEYCWICDTGVPRFGVDGAFLGYIGSAIDITERKRAAEALRQSEEHYRTLAETAADVILTMDKNSTILFVNPAIERVFGYVPADLIGQKITVLIPKRLRQDHLHGMGRYLETGERLLSWNAVSFPGLHKSGREISLEIAFAESGTAERRIFTGIMRDVTERKQAEAELRQQREELAHLTRVSTMGELAASLAHELNQPLTAILSNAQAAQRFLSGKRVDVEEVREILRDIVQDDNRAGEVIRRMRSLVKKEEPEFSSLDLSNIIREIMVLVHSDAVLRNVRVSLDVNPDLPHVRGDKIELQQVLLNLLLNAFDAMKDCPLETREVVVRAESDGEGLVRTSVTDRGTGLTTDKLDKVFQPFYTTKREGLGMGLSICRSIIEAHGGHLSAENNPDGGATFYFTLPIVGEEQATRCVAQTLRSSSTSE